MPYVDFAIIVDGLSSNTVVAALSAAPSWWTSAIKRGVELVPYVSKAQRRERERREAEWRAEEERVRKLEQLFEALPAGEAKEALKHGMTDRVVELYNAAKFFEGDAVLEFLPKQWARQLLDWYFDDDETTPHPADAAASQNENPQPG